MQVLIVGALPRWRGDRHLSRLKSQLPYGRVNSATPRTDAEGGGAGRPERCPCCTAAGGFPAGRERSLAGVARVAGEPDVARSRLRGSGCARGVRGEGGCARWVTDAPSALLGHGSRKASVAAAWVRMWTAKVLEGRVDGEGDGSPEAPSAGVSAARSVVHLRTGRRRRVTTRPSRGGAAAGTPASSGVCEGVRGGASRLRESARQGRREAVAGSREGPVRRPAEGWGCADSCPAVRVPRR